MNLNKGISTPIAIGLIVVVAAVVGVLVWQFTKTSEQPTPKQAGDYTTQSSCEEADYYWYEDACHEEKQTETKLPVPDAPELTFLEGAKPSVQIAWSRQIADYFNIYRATSSKGPWAKIIKQYPKNAGSAVDYDYPKDAEVLYYKITSVNEEGVEGKPSKVSSVELTEGKTANWKTYSNEKHGFEFKYPGNFETKEIPPSDPTGLKITLDEGNIVAQEINDSIINIDLPEDCVFSSDALEEENMLNFAETEEVNGIDFNHYQNYPKYIDAYCGMSTGCTYKDVYRTLYNDKCYQVVYNRSEGNVENIPEVFDQVLSSFEFID